MNTNPIVLVPGHWLGAWAWDDVAADLRERGHAVTAVTLPGLEPDDPRRATVTVADQAEALAAAVRAAGDGTVLVAHSGAGAPTSVLLDRDPGRVARVIYVDSGPSGDGTAFTDALPEDISAVALPPFEELPASLDGLSVADFARFRERAVPEPASVLRDVVHLRNDARRDVPTTIIACSFPSDLVLRMAREGHPMMAEVAHLSDLEIVDLPTGHWPMWSRPADLAAAISRASGQTSTDS